MKAMFAGALLLPLAALAQTPPSSSPLPPTGSSAHSASALGFSDTSNGPAQVLERLQLSDAQQPLWANYVAQLDAYAKLFLEEKPMAAYATDSAVRQFGRLTYVQQNRLAALENMEAAVRRLYAVLSPAQQTVADQMLLGTVPQFGNSRDMPSDSKVRSKREPPGGRSGGAPGGGMGGSNASGGDPSNRIPGQW